MVEGVDEWQGRGAVEGPSVVESGSDIDSRLIDAGDAKVDFSHLFFYPFIFPSYFLFSLVVVFLFVLLGRVDAGGGKTFETQANAEPGQGTWYHPTQECPKGSQLETVVYCMSEVKNSRRWRTPTEARERRRRESPPANGSFR